MEIPFWQLPHLWITAEGELCKGNTTVAGTGLYCTLSTGPYFKDTVNTALFPECQVVYRTREDSLLGDMRRISWGDDCLFIPGLQLGFLEGYQSYSPSIHNPTSSLSFTVQIHLVHAFIFAKKRNGNTHRSCYGISAGDQITPCSISSVEGMDMWVNNFICHASCILKRTWPLFVGGRNL